MDLQLVRLVKALIRGEKLREEERPAQKIVTRSFNGDVVALNQTLVFPTGKVKRVRLYLGNCWSGANFVTSNLFVIPSPLVPMRAGRNIGGIMYISLILGANGAQIHGLDLLFDSPLALENPTLVGGYTGAQGDVCVEVHYE